MFLVPQHLRDTIHSVLTASPAHGPHTALLTSVQGQLYVSGSTYDPDWDESLERPDPAEDATIAGAEEEDEDGEEDDVELDLSMPEWRRTLRGMANKEWKDHIEQGGKDTDRLRLQCDVSFFLFMLLPPLTALQVGKILFVPLVVPAQRTESPDALTRHPQPDGTTSSTEEDTTGRILLVLNGKQGVRWSVLDAKVCPRFRRNIATLRVRLLTLSSTG